MRKRLVPVALTILSTLPSGAQTLVSPGLELEVAAQGLAAPTAMAFIGPDDILVTQKNDGRVLRAIAGELQSTAVLDLAVSNGSEQGLLGLALDPDFPHNRRVFLYYTAAMNADGSQPVANRIARYRFDGTALVEPEVVLDLPVDGPVHNGGVIRFGPDDRLYGVIGDQNRDGKLQNNPAGSAPDDTGVILRLDRDGNGAPGNPFRDAASGGDPLDRYFAYGVRNSFGLAFDPVTGDLWDTENGWVSMDEINHVAPGLNSGWRPIMGPVARSAASEDFLWKTPGSAYSDPEFSWDRCVAPTALAFVLSRRLGCDVEHRLLVGNSNCGTVQIFELDASRTGLVFRSPELQDLVADNLDRCVDEQAELSFGSGFGTITGIENGPDGFVYVLSYTRGTIYRVRPVAPVANDLDSDLVPAACDCDDGSAGSWAAPTALSQLRLSNGPLLQLGWDDRAGLSGPGGAYTVVSGSLDQLRASGGFGGACALETGIPSPSATDPRTNPPPGGAYYYLVRHGNTCSPGTYGDSPYVPDPRDGLDASTPAPCS